MAQEFDLENEYNEKKIFFNFYNLIQFEGEKLVFKKSSFFAGKDTVIILMI